MKNCLFFLLLLPTVGCQTNLKPIEYFTAMKGMSWLEGSWQGEYQGKPFYEKWAFVNDTTLQNYELVFTETDTTTKPNGQITVVDGQVFFMNHPSNGSEPLRWSMADFNQQRVRFENPKAPYSRTIIFEHTPQNDWLATLIMEGDTLRHQMRRMN